MWTNANHPAPHPENEGVAHSHLIESLRPAVDADLELHLSTPETWATTGAIRENLINAPTDLVARTVNTPGVLTIVARGMLLLRQFELVAAEEPRYGHELLVAMQEYQKCVELNRLGAQVVKTLEDLLKGEDDHG